MLCTPSLAYREVLWVGERESRPVSTQLWLLSRRSPWVSHCPAVMCVHCISQDYSVLPYNKKSKQIRTDKSKCTSRCSAHHEDSHELCCWTCRKGWKDQKGTKYSWDLKPSTPFLTVFWPHMSLTQNTQTEVMAGCKTSWATATGQVPLTQ